MSRSVPTHINPGTFFAPSQYAAGGYHSLASFSDATTRAWGYNFYGQLGDGTTVSKSSAVLVPGNPGVSGAGRLASYGGTKAWGYNLDGELGDGTTTARSTPTQVPGLSNIVDIAAGELSSFAVTDDARVWQWGALFKTVPEHVTALPGAPTNPHAIAGDTEATLTWTPPPSVG
ncbi:MAG: RCC1 repeat-containing protein, partial [Chloroflexi bacterium]